jgi:sialate O-acetylesterase
MKIVPLLLVALTLAARADVSVPRTYGDYMVLQQGVKIPIRGWADAGELIQVYLGPNVQQTQADAQGNWRVNFDALTASATPMTLAIGGRNAIEMHNITVGDVWLVVGDGAIGYQIHDEPNGNGLAAKMNNPMLRVYEMENRPGIRPKTIGAGFWHTAAQPWAQGTSALAYFFGQELQQKLGQPVGLIVGSWGGQPIEGWMSKDSLQKIPGYEKPLADIAAREAIFPKNPVAQKATMEDWGQRLHDWDENQNHPWIDAENNWAKARDAAIAAKQPLPPEPKARPDPPKNPDGEPNEVTVLYNGMIAPFTNTPIRGVIWDLGENAGNAPQFETLLHALIDDWRQKWKSELPFIIVDLSNIGDRAPNPTDSGRADIRGAQIAVASAGPNTSLAQTIDLGAVHNGNPPPMPDIGKRIAAAALHIDGQNVPFEGPRFGSMAVEGGKIRVKYANPDVGLVLAASPDVSNTPPNDNPALPLDAPLGFEVAGADKKWVNAKAQIDGNTVLVWSDAVPAPVAVRYAWSANPPVNLYSKDGFPAVPFRTQDWPANP